MIPLFKLDQDTPNDPG